MPAMVAREAPSRAETRRAVRAPRTPPTPPAAKRSPITPGETWTTLTRKTTSTATIIELNRLAVAVVAATARSTGCPKTKRSPSPTSRQRRRSAPRTLAGSRAPMSMTARAETP